MTSVNTAAQQAGSSSVKPDLDVLVIGAGVTGINQLYLAHKAGLSVRLLEAGDGVGGVWYWNRYPGARLDSESYTYGYFFTKELFDGWQWQEEYASQPENERYFNYAVDHLGLRDLIQFGARVTSVVFDEDSATWLTTAADGTRLRSRFVVAATGVLSAPIFPAIPGRESFKGIAHHTGLWPDEPVDFRGKRVAVIGTGSSGIQVIPVIADEVASLTVYQRTPNWCTPLGNKPISPERQEQLRADFEKIKELLDENPSGFLHQRYERKFFEDTEAERWEFYERMWNSPGFATVISHYADMHTDKAVNADWCAFMADKIRSIVKDPETAEKLIPRNHGWAGKRPPFGTDYFEAYNKPQVSLVDTTETPMVRVTETGIETTDGLREFDIIVWASGFDFGTGALTRLGVRGRDGLALEEHWADGPSTFAGIMTHGFPNFFFPGGPHGAQGNNPRYGEDQVNFVADLIEHALERGHDIVEVPAEIEAEWNQMVAQLAAYSPFEEHSYFYGANVEGKARSYLLNSGGRAKLRQTLADAVESEYAGFLA